MPCFISYFSFYAYIKGSSYAASLILEIDISFSGVELVLGTGVKSADVKRKTLLTTTGETISYKYLIIATGARVLKQIFQFECSYLKESFYLVISHACRVFRKQMKETLAVSLIFLVAFFFIGIYLSKFNIISLKIHENY